MTDLLAARSQMAISLRFNILFAAVGIWCGCSLAFTFAVLFA